MKVEPHRWYSSLMVHPRKVRETCNRTKIVSQWRSSSGKSIMSPMVIAAIVYISSVGSRNPGFQTARNALAGATSSDSDRVVTSDGGRGRGCAVASSSFPRLGAHRRRRFVGGKRILGPRYSGGVRDEGSGQDYVAGARTLVRLRPAASFSQMAVAMGSSLRSMMTAISPNISYVHPAESQSTLSIKST